MRWSGMSSPRNTCCARPLARGDLAEQEPPVLLIDEIDRADEEFEAYLLEVLSDFQVTIPELGTIAATTVPHVVLTSNGTRALSDALRRRCLYTYLEFPDEAKEVRILRAHLPGADRRILEQIVGFVQQLRREDLQKKPGVAEDHRLGPRPDRRSASITSRAIPETLQATLDVPAEDRCGFEGRDCPRSPRVSSARWREMCGCCGVGYVAAGDAEERRLTRPVARHHARRACRGFACASTVCAATRTRGSQGQALG